MSSHSWIPGGAKQANDEIVHDCLVNISTVYKKDYKYITNYDITVLDIIGLHYYEIIVNISTGWFSKGRGHFAAYEQSKFYVWS